ncbi:MAG: tetratricopeptide repeat protein [Chitinophagaceae bacterium]|jgi:tetratricopeptide (TPR) repeat protein|nr:tetratricopeptide repeat protein [Chitinophagaceae bacterium]
MLNKNISGLIIFIIFLLTCSCNNNYDDKEPGKQSISTEQQLKNAIKLFPDSLLLIESLIEYYRNNGYYDSAITVTDNALQKDLQNVQLWDIKGTLHYENGDTLQSINAFETAIDIYPLSEYIISLGTLYAQTKNSKALVLADALLIAKGSKVKKEALFIKGLYNIYTSNQQKAIIFFDSCISIDYTYMFAYREKAIALYDLGKFEDALKVLTRAITIQNNFDEGYYWMGRCYEKLGKKKEAIESYQMALMYDKNFIEAKEALVKLGAKEA